MDTAAPISVTSPAPAVELAHASLLYGSFVALRDVSLVLPRGSSVVLLGPNGAGKSTLLRLLAGLANPSYGVVRIFGELASSLRGRIAYMGHQTMLYDELTGPENLRYLLGLQRPSLSSAELQDKVASALGAVGLDPDNQRRLGEYSQGMRQRASLARVLLTDPDLLLLDEPFSNLDVGSAEAMIVRLRQYLVDTYDSSAKKTLILTTHQAQLAQPLASTTLVLENGKLQHTETADASQRTALSNQGYA